MGRGQALAEREGVEFNGRLTSGAPGVGRPEGQREGGGQQVARPPRRGDSLGIRKHYRAGPGSDRSRPRNSHFGLRPRGGAIRAGSASSAKWEGRSLNFTPQLSGRSSAARAAAATLSGLGSLDAIPPPPPPGQYCEGRGVPPLAENSVIGPQFSRRVRQKSVRYPLHRPHPAPPVSKPRPAPC